MGLERVFPTALMCLKVLTKETHSFISHLNPVPASWKPWKFLRLSAQTAVCFLSARTPEWCKQVEWRLEVLMTLGSLMFRRLLAMLNRSFGQGVGFCGILQRLLRRNQHRFVFLRRLASERSTKAIKSNLEKGILMRYAREILKAGGKSCAFREVTGEHMCSIRGGRKHATKHEAIMKGNS